MNEREWLTGQGVAPMLDFLRRLRGGASQRKLRLFACACCRRTWHLLTDERSRVAVGGDHGERVRGCWALDMILSKDL
jgi:hypothetical protein